jgi:F0F1-type ATP synthase delta subunit
MDYLDRLTAAERATLQSQLVANEPVVTTAHLMTVDEQAELRDRLGKRLGANNIRFEQDPALIAGAKIEFAHSILSFNWRDSLDAVKKEVREPHESAG